jgi:hypothetical protein
MILGGSSMFKLKWIGILALAAAVHPASAVTIGAISITVNTDNVLNYDFTYLPIPNMFSDTRNQVLGGVNGDVDFNLVSSGNPDNPIVRQTGTITNLSSLIHTYTIQVGIPLGFAPDPDSSTLGPFTRAISSISGTLTDGGRDGAATPATIMGFSDLLPPGYGARFRQRNVHGREGDGFRAYSLRKSQFAAAIHPGPQR